MTPAFQTSNGAFQGAGAFQDSGLAQVRPAGGVYWQRSLARRRGERDQEQERQIEARRLETLRSTMQELDQAPDEFARAQIKQETQRARKARIREKQAQQQQREAIAIAEERQRLIEAAIGAVVKESQLVDVEEENMLVMLAAVAAMPRL